MLTSTGTAVGATAVGLRLRLKAEKRFLSEKAAERALAASAIKLSGAVAGVAGTAGCASCSRCEPPTVNPPAAG